ncbi:MAG: hypothetical protein WKG07_22235 [Hymenobacter sp.]
MARDHAQPAPAAGASARLNNRRVPLVRAGMQDELALVCQTAWACPARPRPPAARSGCGPRAPTRPSMPAPWPWWSDTSVARPGRVPDVRGPDACATRCSCSKTGACSVQRHRHAAACGRSRWLPGDPARSAATVSRPRC